MKMKKFAAFALGFLLASVVGVFLGFFMATSRRAQDILDPACLMLDRPDASGLLMSQIEEARLLTAGVPLCPTCGAPFLE